MALAVGGVATSQSTFDFEFFNLSAESYENGSAGNGDFIFTQNETIQMTNVYDTAWGSWNGFSISNMTDVTTPGWMNQFSAYTGSGAGGSANYAVHYNPGTISGGDDNTAITEFKITNTTYAALSMRDGDGYGKQFGSPKDASGSPDGTNGEDYFKVWIICESVSGDKDSIEFFLADYRFADSTQDYIVETWETIDLTSIAFDVNVIDFKYESTDNDPTWGIKTPTYFAIDDIKTVSTLNVIESELENITMYPNPTSEILNIVGADGEVKMFDTQGKLVYSEVYVDATVINVSDFTPGIYVIRVENASGLYTNRIAVK